MFRISYTDFAYTKLTNGAENFYTIPLAGSDGIYSVSIYVTASDSTDAAEFNQFLTLKLSSGTWSILQMTILPGLLPTTGATNWSLSIGAIVSDTITLTATSPIDVVWAILIDLARISD